MKIVDIPVERREKLGSANSRRYRRAGQIPCCLYGRGKENVNLVTPALAFGNVLKAHTALVNLTLADGAQTALVRDVEWDVFGDYVVHVDFTRVEMADEVKIKVPVHFVGIPVGVGHGGVTEVVKSDVEVFSRVDSIPSEFKVDISGLDMHDSVYVEDLEYPENVRPSDTGKDLLVHVVEPKKVIEPEEGETPEGEEGAPAEGAEGEAPAAEGEGGDKD